jgi:MFS family permease
LPRVVSAYAVAFGGFLPLGGRSADKPGTRRMFMAAPATYGVASLIGGLATAPWVLVAARALQGAGAKAPVVDLANGLQAAGWVAAAATLVGGLVVLTLEKTPPAPIEPAVASGPEQVAENTRRPTEVADPA